MFFVSKKKYNELKASRERWKVLADRWMSHAEDANKLAYEWEKMALCCQEDNKRLVAHEEEMLTKMKELEIELQEVRRDNQRWAKDFEELDLAYGRLDTDYDKLREERDHYEERCRYLEGEVEDKEELEAKLAFAIQQRDYYYDLLEDTSEVHVGDVIVKEETDK